MPSNFRLSLSTLAIGLIFSPSVHAIFPTQIHGLGDSYAAGLGAGKLLDSDFKEKPEFGCLQFDGGYVHRLFGLAFPGQNTDDANRTVNLACSGAKAQDVIDDQIPNVGGADLITLQVGGNDVGFADILGNCVMNSCFKGACGTTDCDSALAAGTNIVNTQIQGKLLSTYQALQQKMTSSAHVLVIGYTQFWNAATDQCDSADWGVLRSNLMTKDKRQAMNTLSISMNQKIEAAVNQLNDPRFKFVNPDPFFEGHRFCEDGITEPQQEGQDREDLFIHEWYTPQGQFDGTVLNDTLNGPWNTLEKSILGEAANEGKSSPLSGAFPKEMLDSGVSIQKAGGLPPKLAGYFKVFHPTQAGHDAILQAIQSKVNAIPNQAGTNMHPNATCILVRAGGPNPKLDLACEDIHGSINLPDQGLENSTATIQLIPTSAGSPFGQSLLTPTAEATVSWPRFFGDVRLNKDNCLVDAGFSSIGKQCVTTTTSSFSAVTNPAFTSSDAPFSSIHMGPGIVIPPTPITTAPPPVNTAECCPPACFAGLQLLDKSKCSCCPFPVKE